MSYLPQLRESLVKAAERQLETPASVPARAPRRRFGSVVLVAASLAALVVAGVVLVLAGHRSSPSPTPAAATLTSPRAAAASLLAEVQAPKGAVLAGGDPVARHRLTRPVQPIPLPGGVDLYRIYRLSGDPETIVNSVGNAVRRVDVNSGANSASVGDASAGAGGGTATQVMSMETRGGVVRSLQLHAVSIPHGPTLLRVDAQAWPALARPTTDRLPEHATAIEVAAAGTPPSARLHPPSRLTGSAVTQAITFINGLGLVQPGTPSCDDPSRFALRLTLLGTGQRPAPVAVVRPGCSAVVLFLRGQAQLPLTMEISRADLLAYTRFMESLLGLPRSKTWGDAVRLLGTPASSSSSSSGSSSSGTITAPARQPPTQTAP